MSAKQKPLTPYQRLQNRFREWADNVECRKRVFMWRYPKEKLVDVLHAEPVIGGDETNVARDDVRRTAHGHSPGRPHPEGRGP